MFTFFSCDFIPFLQKETSRGKCNGYAFARPNKSGENAQRGSRFWGGGTMVRSELSSLLEEPSQTEVGCVALECGTPGARLLGRLSLATKQGGAVLLFLNSALLKLFIKNIFSSTKTIKRGKTKTKTKTQTKTKPQPEALGDR